MDTQEAVKLRQKLEADILALLRGYREATGLTPTRINVEYCDACGIGGPSERNTVVTNVRVRVEV
jgi:hypothetical protein